MGFVLWNALELSQVALCLGWLDGSQVMNELILPKQLLACFDVLCCYHEAFPVSILGDWVGGQVRSP